MGRRQLDGKVAIVTGAARGLGEAIAHEFAVAGARVAILDIDAQAAEVTAASLTGARSYQCDVAEVSAVDQVFEQVEQDLGPLDILVNNAGISVVGQETHELPDQVWDRTISVLQSGVFYCSRAAGRRMIEQGHGSIINVASIRGLAPKPGRLAYCTAKAAVLMMTRVMAAEWAASGVRVNAIAPGFQQTKMLEEEIEAGRLDLSRTIGTIPMQRLGEPREIGQLCLFLASDEAAYITGASIVSDGGLTCLPAA